ncbi:MAG: hypothetical protein KDK36_13995 [Leptospiraceae bacterium]|nr:hypothetical protein [Leptospiraceae bacterium]
MKMLKLAIVSLLFFIPAILIGDTVILKNKQVYKGFVTAQNQNSLTIKLKNGKKQTFSKRTILRVVYKDLSAQEVKKVIQEEEKKAPPKKDPVPVKKEVPTKEEPPAKEEEPPVKDEKEVFIRNKWSPTWRSAIIPGWGLFYMERKTPGWYHPEGEISKWEKSKPYVLGAGALIVGGLIVQNYNNYKTANKEYDGFVAGSYLVFLDNSSNIDRQFGVMTLWNNAKYDKFKSKTDSANNMLRIGAVFYGLQLMYTFYQGVKWENLQPAETNSEGDPVSSGWNLDYSNTMNAFTGKVEPNYKLIYTFRF